MDAVEKELESRRVEIKKTVELMFKANMKITDWDVPEVDDKKAAQILLRMMQEALDEIKTDIAAGKYDYY